MIQTFGHTWSNHCSPVVPTVQHQNWTGSSRSVKPVWRFPHGSQNRRVGPVLLFAVVMLQLEKQRSIWTHPTRFPLSNLLCFYFGKALQTASLAGVASVILWLCSSSICACCAFRHGILHSLVGRCVSPLPFSYRQPVWPLIADINANYCFFVLFSFFASFIRHTSALISHKELHVITLILIPAAFLARNPLISISEETTWLNEISLFLIHYVFQ